MAKDYYVIERSLLQKLDRKLMTFVGDYFEIKSAEESSMGVVSYECLVDQDNLPWEDLFEPDSNKANMYLPDSMTIENLISFEWFTGAGGYLNLSAE